MSPPVELYQLSANCMSASSADGQQVFKQSVICDRCYVTRTSLKCVSPGLSYGKSEAGLDGNGPTWAPDDDTRVCFQYSAIDSAPKGSAGYKTDDQLYDQLVADLKSYGAQDVKVLSHALRVLLLPCITAV